ncbi:MAG: helix-turn-helix transcriptional regulator [Eubacterium sp.]|nr:helix-turn-helix transcriptional regulator [Eubacterium sp.]
MDKERMGAFISRIRKEKKLTQKELAEQLHVTDKAVSKWERGMSYPDISMLESIAEILEISVLELLEGERISDDASIEKEEAQQLLCKSISISDDEINRKHIRSKSIILFAALIIMLLLSIILNILNYERDDGKAMLSVDSGAYETVLDDNGTVVFTDPQKALEQLAKDLGVSDAYKKEVQ